MRLSDMTADEVVFALRATTHVEERRERALRAISALALVPRGRETQDARDLLDEWFEEDGRSAKTANAAHRTSVTTQPVHRPTVEAAIAMGVPLAALALCADANGGMASADLGEHIDQRQVTVSAEEDSYRVLVPLTADLYTDGWQILVRKGVLPDTVLTALAGKAAWTVAEHGALAGRTIRAVADRDGAFQSLLMNPPPLQRWDTFA